MHNSLYDGWVMLVCNPVSGVGKGRERLAVIERLFRQRGTPFKSALTTQRGDAVTLARLATASGCGMVVAVGGDGTLFEVVNGVMGPAGLETPPPMETNRVAVGLVGAGRGSDFARSIGIPSDPESAARRLLGGRMETIDLGHVVYNSFRGEKRARWFANSAGMGFDAEVAVRANSAPKALGGTVSYLGSLFTTLVSYSNKHIKVRIDGEEEWEGRANSIVMANGQYFGGGMKIAPDARLSDGHFDVVTLGDLGKIDLVRNVPRVYDGSHITHPKVHVARASQIEIESDHRLLLQADGEVLGTAPATFTLAKSALRVVV